jgi:hypothetical protein
VLIDFNPASLAPAPQAHVDYVASVADLKGPDWVEAEPAPDFPDLLPITTHLLMSAQGSNIGEHARDVEHGIVGIHGLHEIELASVPALEPFGELIKPLSRDLLGDSPSLTPSDASV